MSKQRYQIKCIKEKHKIKINKLHRKITGPSMLTTLKYRRVVATVEKGPSLAL